MMLKSFPIIFWRHNMLAVFSIPHNIDKKLARRRIQAMFDREKSYKFKIKRSNG
jgi:hypothetical protein